MNLVYYINCYVKYLLVLFYVQKSVECFIDSKTVHYLKREGVLLGLWGCDFAKRWTILDLKMTKYISSLFRYRTNRLKFSKCEIEGALIARITNFVAEPSAIFIQKIRNMIFLVKPKKDKKSLIFKTKIQYHY